MQDNDDAETLDGQHAVTYSETIPGAEPTGEHVVISKRVGKHLTVSVEVMGFSPEVFHTLTGMTIEQAEAAVADNDKRLRCSVPTCEETRLDHLFEMTSGYNSFQSTWCRAHLAPPASGIYTLVRLDALALMQ